jgi:hypothetical protein
MRWQLRPRNGQLKFKPEEEIPRLGFGPDSAVSPCEHVDTFEEKNPRKSLHPEAEEEEFKLVRSACLNDSLPASSCASLSPAPPALRLHPTGINSCKSTLD